MKPEYIISEDIELTGTLLDKVCVAFYPNSSVRFITTIETSEMPNNWILVKDSIKGFLLNYNIPKSIHNNVNLRKSFEIQISELMIETLSNLREEMPEEFI